MELEFVENFKICPVNSYLEVSQYGKVRRANNKEILKQTTYKNYLIVEDPRKIKSFEWVHRLVAFTWLDENEPHNNEVVHHKDKNGFNNRVDNLYWLKGEEHAEVHGIEVLDE